MARAWSVAQFRTRARSEADMVNSAFVTDAELLNFLNYATTEVWDLLVQAGSPDYYASSQGYTTVQGLIQYPLPSDFYKLATLYAIEPQQRFRPIVMVNDFDRSKFWAPQAAYNLQLDYIPCCPVLASPTDMFDGVNGWEELIVAMMVRDMLAKEESDTTNANNKIAEMRQRIINTRDRGGGPQFITDLDRANQYWPWFSSVQITGYRVRANTIEFYEPLIPYYGW